MPKTKFIKIEGGEEVFNKWNSVFDNLKQLISNVEGTSAIVQNDMILPREAVLESRSMLFDNLVSLDIEYKKSIEEVKKLWNESTQLMEVTNEPEDYEHRTRKIDP